MNDLRMHGLELRDRKNARVLFLRAHPELWNKDNKTIVAALKQAGLISPKTYERDVKATKIAIQAAKLGAL